MMWLHGDLDVGVFKGVFDLFAGDRDRIAHGGFADIEFFGDFGVAVGKAGMQPETFFLPVGQINARQLGPEIRFKLCFLSLGIGFDRSGDRFDPGVILAAIFGTAHFGPIGINEVLVGFTAQDRQAQDIALFKVQQHMVPKRLQQIFCVVIVAGQANQIMQQVGLMEINGLHHQIDPVVKLRVQGGRG